MIANDTFVYLHLELLKWEIPWLRFRSRNLLRCREMNSSKYMLLAKIILYHIPNHSFSEDMTSLFNVDCNDVPTQKYHGTRRGGMR